MYLAQVSPSQSYRSRSGRREPLPIAPSSMFLPATPTSTDLEPLPLGQSVKVNFNESSSTVQSDDSFEDVMSEFCQNMGVAV